MRKLLLDGIPVCLSSLTQRPFRAVACDLLLDVTPKTQAEALKAFRRTGAFTTYRGLRVAGIGDLSFLQEFPNLLYLEVVDQPRVDPRHLEGLTNLRGLRLEEPGAGIDFSWFPELEVFDGDWHKDYRHIDRCGELRRLSLRHFKPEQSDLRPLGKLTRLEQLYLVQTSIASLAGLEMLEDLRYLEIAYAPKLTSLEAFHQGGADLREFRLEKAKAVACYAPIAAIPRLRRLWLSNSAAMPDLQWTAGLAHLDFFSFVETNVVDGDLTPLLALPKLRYVGTMDKKHYSHKFNALNELLKQSHPAPGDE